MRHLAPSRTTSKTFFSKNQRVTSRANVVMQSGNEVRFAPISRGIFVPGMAFQNCIVARGVILSFRRSIDSTSREINNNG
ncbi:MAG TPA: hypothetical protein VFA91_03640 [Candidatus Polarisedimenticolia bacterium]|nr:hypothetical protein [Candidatus Polarisedimenticolia bacterium]